MGALLRVRDLHVDFGRRRVEALHGIDLTVEAGARVGLIVRPFREGVRVSVGSREQNDLFYSVAAEFVRTHGISA